MFASVNRQPSVDNGFYLLEAFVPSSFLLLLVRHLLLEAMHLFLLDTQVKIMRLASVPSLAETHVVARCTRWTRSSLSHQTASALRPPLMTNNGGDCSCHGMGVV